VALLLDTGIVYAYYDRSDRWHGVATQLLSTESGGLLLPGPVVPEIDHLLGARLGAEARHVFYRGLIEASFLVVDLAQERIARVAEIDRQFADLGLGFVDSAIVAVAESLGVSRVATTDRRHFKPVAPAFGLELLPTNVPDSPPSEGRGVKRRRGGSRSS
jgi:predicted nucleic acid-binding protein